jgi:hypothetical protein
MMAQISCCDQMRWPRITDEQRELDRRIRLAQAEARQQMDEALRVGGRVWSDGQLRPAMEGRRS